jgi:hypothetical protein
MPVSPAEHGESVGNIFDLNLLFFGFCRYKPDARVGSDITSHNPPASMKSLLIQVFLHDTHIFVNYDSSLINGLNRQL